MKTETKSYTLDNAEDFKNENERLGKQAKVMFEFEKKKFQEIVSKKNKKLLDFGCGNASFLNLASPYFQESIGIDINEKLILEGKKKFPHLKISHVDPMDKDELQELLHSTAPSTLIMRFVVQHLNESELWLVDEITNYCKNNNCLFLIIDVDDSEITSIPAKDFIRSNVVKLTDYLSSKGGNRILNKKIKETMNKFGEKQYKMDKIDIKFDRSNKDDFFEIVFPAFVKTDNDSSEEQLILKYDDFFANDGGAIHFPIFYHQT
jgi:SAM-dependent methyltransferase